MLCFLYIFESYQHTHKLNIRSYFLRYTPSKTTVSTQNHNEIILKIVNEFVKMFQKQETNARKICFQ